MMKLHRISDDSKVVLGEGLDNPIASASPVIFTGGGRNQSLTSPVVTGIVAGLMVSLTTKGLDYALYKLSVYRYDREEKKEEERKAKREAKKEGKEGKEGKGK